MMARQIELIERIVRGEQPPPPVAMLLGLRMVGFGPGTAVVEMDVDERHANPMGTLHGGMLSSAADAAMGIAFATTLDDGESMATVELKINFLKPVWKARLRFLGRVVKRGRTLGLVECDALDEANQLVARASCTCMVLRDEHAQGR
jgi:uncharacterized protein (TIGR00369 family)